MKKFTISIACIIVLLLWAGQIWAQDDAVDRVTVDLTDPGKPASVKVGLVAGSITVNGYDGRQVIVEAKTRLKKVSHSDRGNGKAGGMIRIPVSSSSLTVEEYNNVIEIGTESWKNPIDLVITVPRKTSLSLSCVNSGDIEVEGVSGEIEAENVNGKVTLLAISGSAVAHAHNGDVTVRFNDIDPDKDMSFSSFNGDIDVAFPASLKAKVKLKTTMGEIFSDFPITEIKNPRRVIEKNSREEGGRYKVEIDRSYWGTINGGGQEIQFSNYNGDIYIRSLD